MTPAKAISPICMLGHSPQTAIWPVAAGFDDLNRILPRALFGRPESPSQRPDVVRPDQPAGTTQRGTETQRSPRSPREYSRREHESRSDKDNPSDKDNVSVPRCTTSSPRPKSVAALLIQYSRSLTFLTRIQRSATDSSTCSDTCSDTLLCAKRFTLYS